MLRLTSEQSEIFARAVDDAARRAAGVEDIAAIYAEFATALVEVKPRCEASGACCRFESYGHRLFITTIEMAAFTARVDVAAAREWDGTGCPYQVAGRCTAHAARPFGCRVYFCDARTTDWQQQQYERMHRQLRALHERHDVPYLYVEWREALKACGLAEVAASDGRRLPIIR